MSATRKIAMVVNHVHVDEGDERDIAFWLAKTPADRLSEVCRLRRSYFNSADGVFPDKMGKVISFKSMVSR